MKTNNNGFTLIGVMISMGITSMVLLAQTKMNANQTKATRSTKANNHREELKASFRDILAITENCSLNFAGKNISNSYTFPANEYLYINPTPATPTGTIALTRGIPFGEKTLEVVDFSFGNNAPLMMTGTQAMTTFNVNFKRTGDQYGGQTIQISIPIHTYVDASNNVTSCNAVSPSGGIGGGSGGANLWSVSATDSNNIFSDITGNVGIGVSDPAFKLQVAGSAHIDDLTTGHSTNVLGEDQTLSSIMGGSNNTITGKANSSFILGGNNNQVNYSGTSNNWARGGIISGYNNLNQGNDSVMIAGRDNINNQNNSTNNLIGGNSSLMFGGYDNINNGASSTMIGGHDNEIQGGYHNTILHGQNNKVEYSETGPTFYHSLGNYVVGSYNTVKADSHHNFIFGSGNKTISGVDKCFMLGSGNTCQKQSPSATAVLIGGMLKTPVNGPSSGAMSQVIVGINNDISTLNSNDVFVVGTGSNTSSAPANGLRVQHGPYDSAAGASKGGNVIVGNSLYVGDTPLANGNINATGNIRAVGSILAGQSISSTAFYQTSDRRHKQNIDYSESQLDNILALRPASYEYKKFSGKKRNGLIAQEVNEVFPHLVNKADDSKWTVNMVDLIGPAIGAFQESHANNQDEVAALKKEIKELKELVCLSHPTAKVCQ